MIHTSSHIDHDVHIGNNVYIGPNCIIGYPAEDKKFWDKDTDYSVIIHDNAVIHGNVTIDAGTIRHTEIGSDTFIMKGTHIGHDSIIMDDVTIACHALIGGHVVIKTGANIGLGAIIHPRQYIGEYCMIGMGSVIPSGKHIRPCYKYYGSPVKEAGINYIGLQRNDIDEKQMAEYIKKFNEGRNSNGNLR